MNRERMFERVRSRVEPWDVVVIGGGATGLGTAVDAAARGYAVALFEKYDLAKGTSSRSTKLVHGGVRYLQQGDVGLVMGALRERGLLRQNAPHLVHEQPFVIPSYEWWESPFYGLGLKVYDLLAGRYGFGKSEHLSPDDVVAAVPTIRRDGLRGGTRYRDGQFDDARLAVNLAQTAVERGGVVLTYAPVVAFVKDGRGVIAGVEIEDRETGARTAVAARVVVNATGPFADAIRRLDVPDAAPIIAPGQGSHVVVDRSLLAGDEALMVPHTPDGRVLFAVPWHGVVVVGTTDVPIETVPDEPAPAAAEIDFILDAASRYLARPLTRADVRSSFAGVRPLVRVAGAASTASLSRDHTILIDPTSRLLTVAGGKWTTYRKMAEDVVDHAAELGGLAARPCPTRDLPVHGATATRWSGRAPAFYGADAPGLERLLDEDPELVRPLHERLPLCAAQIIWACRHELARTVEDVLARRTRCLLFDARAAIEVAAETAQVMARELGRDAAWIEREVAAFRSLARGYVVDA